MALEHSEVCHENSGWYLKFWTIIEGENAYMQLNVGVR